MAPYRKNEPGYFVVIDADGAEVPNSRRDVPAGVDVNRDKAIVEQMQAGMGPDCYVTFKPRGGFR